MKKSFKRAIAFVLCFLMILTAGPLELLSGLKAYAAQAANETLKNHYLFAYFTGNDRNGQTIHLAVSKDGYNYTSLHNNDPVIVPSKGTGSVRDPYIWYNEQDNYYYIIVTDMDSTDGWNGVNEGFLIWRSKDLIHWYDETSIDLTELSHLVGDTSDIHVAWAPQVMWDGEAYMLYFAYQTNNANFQSYKRIVYLRTTDLLNTSAYFEFGTLVDKGADTIDADIIKHPTNGKYYLFYRHTNTGIYYVTSDKAYGPYSEPTGSVSGKGYLVKDYYNDGSTNHELEGCNSFFDNDGNLITYYDAYYPTPEFFVISKANSDFTSFSWVDLSAQADTDTTTGEINTLYPRHGSVVKITETEYTRLLNNYYGISASTLSMHEDINSHLVAQYFTTSSAAANSVSDKAGLTGVTNVTMQYTNGRYQANFTEGYATVDLSGIFTEGLNYHDGFTISFTATTNSSQGNNDRIYEIGKNGFGDNTAYYTHFSPTGTDSGAYIGSKNSSSDQFFAMDGKKYNDGTEHDYLITYANGNVIMFVDGELAIKYSRFNGNASAAKNQIWFDNIATGTMRIGLSGWDSDPKFSGNIHDFRIYDRAMSIYDYELMKAEEEGASGYTKPAINSITSETPSFNGYSVGYAGRAYSNVLYSPNLSDMPTGGKNSDKSDANADAASASVRASGSNSTTYGVYYAKNTVLYYDGVNTPIMPVMFAARRKEKVGVYIYQVYPTSGAGSTADNQFFSLIGKWVGWNNDAGANYNDQIEVVLNGGTPPDGYVGHNAAENANAGYNTNVGYDGQRKKVGWFSNAMKLNTSAIVSDAEFIANGYKSINLTWHLYTEKLKGTYAADNNTYVLDVRALNTYRNTVNSEFDTVLNNAIANGACAQAIANYVKAAQAICQFNLTDYDISRNATYAVAACSSEMAAANAAYDRAKQALVPCATGVLKLTFPGRAATCALAGLTDGEYCAACGKIVKEQEMISPLAHSYESFTQDGKEYVKCTVCGFQTTKTGHEIYYENLFHLGKWKDSTSNNIAYGSATIEPNVENGTITLVNNASSGEVYSLASGDGKRTFTNYCIPVTGGEKYVLEFTNLYNTQGQIFIFTYDVNGNHVGSYGEHYKYANNTTSTYTLEAAQNVAYVELRFDNDTPNSTVKFANIGFYTLESYESYAINNARAAQHFVPGDEHNKLEMAKREGYAFLGWYTASGEKVVDTNQFTVSETLYARWEKVGTDVNYFGNLISLVDYSKSGGATIANDHPDAQVGVDLIEGVVVTQSEREGANHYKVTDQSNQCDNSTNYGYSHYTIPVTAGKEYVFTFTADIWQNIQAYIRFFDASGGDVWYTSANQYVNNYMSEATVKGTTMIMRFTVPSGATKLTFRLGTTGQYDYRREFSNIGLFTAADYSEFISANCPIRTYVPKNTNVDLPVISKADSTFGGWYDGRLGSGTQLTSTASLTSSKIVYPKWVANPDVNYDNIFSFSDWMNSNSRLPHDASRGTVSFDITKGTATVSSTSGGELFTSYSSSGSYRIPVESSTEYIFSADLTGNTSTQRGQMFVFFYASSGAGATGAIYNGAVQSNPHIGTYPSTQGTTSLTFTTPENCTQIGIRIGATDVGATVTYSNIAIYKTSKKALLDTVTNRDYRDVVSASTTLYTPVSSDYHYSFDGWYSDEAYTTSVTSVSGLTSSTTLYSKWYYSPEIRYDNLFSFDSWANSASSTGNRLNVSVDPIAKTITTTATGNDGYTYYGVNSSHYLTSVTPGETYILEYTVDINKNQVFVFFLNEAGTDWNGNANKYRAAVGTNYLEFTVPAGTTKIAYRFGNNETGDVTTFSNIALYKKSNKDALTSVNNRQYSTLLGKNDVLYTPVRDGYNFDGWYLDEGYTTPATKANLTSSATVYSKWSVRQDLLSADAYVLDFALKTQFNVLENDEVTQLENVKSYTVTGLSTTSNGTFSSSANGIYGIFSINGNNVEYTPTSFINDITETVYYKVTFTIDGKNETLVASVSVIPATVVYYEDDTDAVTYTNGVSADNSTGVWTIDGISKTDSITENLANDVYGYSDAYATDTSDFSMGAAHVVTVSAKNNPNATYSGSDGNSWPVAQFTFAGTGFDVVSLISRDTGAVRVVITDSSSKVCYNWLVDTYYGYTIENGDWVVTDVENELYQIPVIGKFDMPFDTYTVTITPMYTTSLDHNKDGDYQFYLDAIRIYNPADGDMDAAMLYGQDNEYIMTHRPIRDILVDAGTLNPEGTNSVVYINPGVQEGTFEQYSQAGPKNETYLAKGQSVAFNLTVDVIPSSVQVSAHALSGTAAMRFASGASSSNAVSITHKTTLYYAIPFMSDAYWIANDDGTYTTKAPIVITNNGEGILSLCNIKCTTDGFTAAPAMFCMSLDDFDIAVASAANISTMSADDEGVFVPDSSDVDAPASVRTGESIELTLTSSADVDSVNVNGEKMELVAKNEDGTKVWSSVIENAETGVQSFSFVAFNADGIKSEETTVTVDVQSKLQHFFAKLVEFIKLIINFFSTFTK